MFAGRYSYIDRPVGLLPKFVTCVSEAADALGASATRVDKASAVVVASAVASAARVFLIGVFSLPGRRPARARDGPGTSR